MAFAESEFALSETVKDGATVRDHLNALWRASGVQPKELAEAPDIPALAVHIWEWFCDLHRDRAISDFGGPARISASQVRDWEWFAGVELELWERKALKRIDSVFFSSRSKK